MILATMILVAGIATTAAIVLYAIQRPKAELRQRAQRYGELLIAADADSLLDFYTVACVHKLASNADFRAALTLAKPMMTGWTVESTVTGFDPPRATVAFAYTGGNGSTLPSAPTDQTWLHENGKWVTDDCKNAPEREEAAPPK